MMCGAPGADRIDQGLFRDGKPSSGSRQGGDSVTDQASQAGIQLNRRLLAGGGALVGIGALLGLGGVLLLSTAFVSATRQWVNQLERPPSETAKLRWQQARAAAAAGAEAWRNGSATQSQVASPRQRANQP
jgi:hypothetical protein